MGKKENESTDGASHDKKCRKNHEENGIDVITRRDKTNAEVGSGSSPMETVPNLIGNNSTADCRRAHSFTEQC